jgi:hypothetical protein
MVEVVELGPGAGPREHKDWVLVQVSKDAGATTGTVHHSAGVTFVTPPSPAEIELNIDHAKDYAEERGIKRIYVQRNAG